MYDEPEKILRELAQSEPLAERARRMTDIPPELTAATVNAMPAVCKDFLTLPAGAPIYKLDGANYALRIAVSTLTNVQKNKILGCLKVPNGIKMVRVNVDTASDTSVLEVHFFNVNYLSDIVAKYNANKSLAKDLFPVSGGTRVRAGAATGQVQIDSSANPLTPAIVMPDADQPVLVLTVKPIGDYSTYTLDVNASIVANTLFDPLFSDIRFKFRPGCFNTNCAPEWETSPEPLPEPSIDYLAKDYGSFRSTMIAAMMERVPQWQPTSEADLDMVLAELFSVAADELSDYQDRVMNEAYLASARKRVSLARHGRLMDYHLHEGCQASTWLALEIEHDKSPQKSFQLKEGLTVWAGDGLTDTNEDPADSAVVFISRSDQPKTVHQYLNSIGLYTWGDSITTLKHGSTRADLRLYNLLYVDDLGVSTAVTDQASAVEIQDIIRQQKVSYLLIEEHLNPETGLQAGRDPSKRQLLRLLAGDDGATAMLDPITGEWFIRVRWRREDELRRDYCFTIDCPSDAPGTAIGKARNISLFHGNLVEVFHGRSQTTIFKDEGEELLIDPAKPLEFHQERTRFGIPGRWGVICRLPETALAYQQTPAGGDVPPISTLKVSVTLSGGGDEQWFEVPSLIHSDDSSENGNHFIVETDENRRSLIRFGNGKNGRELPGGTVVTCAYQFGLPLEGNVGADVIVHFDKKTIEADPAILALHSCWNPFDVINGRDREPVAEAIRRIPEAYRYRQLRAVTLQDYVSRAEEIDGVSRATARYAWTGSWRTVQVTIDPKGTEELTFEVRKTVEDYLNAVRLIGEDLEIRPPIFVSLDILVKLCASPDVWPEDIQFVLEQEFSTGWTPGGQKGFFHPDLWTFGQPLYASQIIGRVLQVKGVEHLIGQNEAVGGVDETISVSIKRWNSPSLPVDSFTQLNYNEIIRVMSDPDHLEQGFIKFEVKGGRQ